MTRRPTVAVSGLGSIGRQHATALRSLGATVVGFDPASSFREDALAAGIVDDVVADFDDLLAGRPAALVVAAPDFAHLDQLDRATRLGIPTLVEKPMAESLAAARAAIDGIEANPGPGLVGYVLRHRLSVATVRRLVRDGAVGRPVTFQVMLGAYGTITGAASRFARHEPDRLYRDYSHEWDYLRWIFGPPRRVLAVARTVDTVPHVESPNAVDGLIDMGDALVGSFHIDYVDPRGTRTLHILGTRGTLQADIAQGVVRLRAAGETDERVFRLGETAAGPLARQAEHLLAVAEGGEEPRVTLRDGLAALEVTDALIRSAADGGWVDVPGEAAPAPTPA